MQVCTLLQTDNRASTPPLRFLQAGCPSCHPTNSIKALKATCFTCFSLSGDLLLLRPFSGLCYRTAWVSQYQKVKPVCILNEARDDGVLGCSGISWTICIQSALSGNNCCKKSFHLNALQQWSVTLSHTHLIHLTALFPGLPRWAGTRKIKPTNHHSVFFTGQMPFLPPNQQCQSTEGIPCVTLSVVNKADAFMWGTDVYVAMKQASYRAALLSAGCALNVADEVLSGQVENRHCFYPFGTEGCILSSL